MCTKCSANNREADETCFSCGSRFSELEVEQELAKAIAVEEVGQERKATVREGLRAGAAAGAVLGALAAVWMNLPGRRRQAWIMTMPLGEVLFYSLGIFLGVVVFCLGLGAVLGAMDELCYEHDAPRIGGYYGAAVGFLAWLVSGTTMFGFNGFLLLWFVLASAGGGAFAGSAICYVEKKYFRGMYAEMQDTGWGSIIGRRYY